MNPIFYEDFDGFDYVIIFKTPKRITMLTCALIALTILNAVRRYKLSTLIDQHDYYSKIKQCDVTTLKISVLPF